MDRVVRVVAVIATTLHGRVRVFIDIAKVDRVTVLVNAVVLDLLRARVDGGIGVVAVSVIVDHAGDVVDVGDGRVSVAIGIGIGVPGDHVHRRVFVYIEITVIVDAVAGAEAPGLVVATMSSQSVLSTRSPGLGAFHVRDDRIAVAIAVAVGVQVAASSAESSSMSRRSCHPPRCSARLHLG